MKKSFLLVSLLLFLFHAAYAQIDQSIPTPTDLQKDDIKIVTKQRLPDGTIEIRYVNKNGRTMKRRTIPGKPGMPEKMEEWDETNVGEQKTNADEAMGGVPVSGGNEAKAGGVAGGSQKPPEGVVGDTTRGQKQNDSALKGAGEGAKSVKDEGKTQAKEDVPKASGPGPVLPVKDTPGIGAENSDRKGAKAASAIADHTTAKGTGQTTGNIANIEVENTGETPITVLPQTAYIPSSGQYQPYIAIIPGTTLPAGETTIIPVTGYCADVHKPPVSNGDPMPPIYTWIPVGDPNAPVPEGSVNIIPTIPVLPFHPSDIPGILNAPEYKSTPPIDSDTPVIITWPGTDIPVGGTFVPGENPEQFAPVIVNVYEEVTKAVKVIQSSNEYTTPFTADSVKEHQALTQNVLWIYTAELSGDKYEKDDFGTNLYKQFETTTGRTVASLPEEQKERIDSGIDDFWNVFTAVGVEAKVISNPQTTTTPPPEKGVPPPEKVKGNCTLTEKVSDTGPKLDYAIADTGTKDKNEKVKEAFKKAIEEVAGIISDAKGADTVDIGFTAPEMPASAWSVYFPHVVAGQANATAFGVNHKVPSETAWSTEPLETKAEGEHNVILTHHYDKNCTSTLVGINYAKVRAASELKASLGSIGMLKAVNYAGEIAVGIATGTILSKGIVTYIKLAMYLKIKSREMAKEEAKEFIKKQLQKTGKELEGKSDEEAEQRMDELLKEIKAGEEEGITEKEAKEFLDDWIAEIIVEGDFNPAAKIVGDIIDKVDSPIDWSPIKTNTYAIGEGSLDVWVDSDHGVAKSASGVRYKREELESKEEAEKGGGVFCDEGIASKTTSGTITLKTQGKTASYAGATGGGIVSTGHGVAVASLESFNGMFVIAICECPDITLYDFFESITVYSTDETMSGIWGAVFENLMQDVIKDLDEAIESAASTGENLPKDYNQKMQKDMENAAVRAGKSILPCPQAE